MRRRTLPVNRVASADLAPAANRLGCGLPAIELAAKAKWRRRQEARGESMFRNRSAREKLASLEQPGTEPPKKNTAPAKRRREPSRANKPAVWLHHSRLLMYGFPAMPSQHIWTEK